MLPPSTMVATLTLMVLATPPLTFIVALPVLIIADCIVGTCVCGMAMAANHMWRSRTKTRPKRNEQQVENQRVSAHETVD